MRYGALLLLLPTLASAFTCAPKEFGGTGTYFTWSEVGTGRAALWVCAVLADGSPFVNYLTWRTDALPAAGCIAATVRAKLATGADVVPQANLAMSACKTTSLGTDLHITDPVQDAAFQPGRAAVLARWAADHPAVAAWRVDSPTSADGTRPAYPYANGVRSTISTARAASGQPCRPEVAASPYGTTGSQTQQYAAFGPDYAPGMVALCKRQP